MPRRLDIAATTTEALSIAADAYVVIDCLRATTTIATLFAGGLAGLWAASDIETARRLARIESALLFGEVGGLPPDGFDAGNSPVEATSLEVSGKTAVLFTTNGTAALTALSDRGAVYAASAVNATAIVSAIAQYQSVALVCAGEAKGARFALEDFAVAATMVQMSLEAHGDAVLGDLAVLASELADPLSLIPRAAHTETLRRLGLGQDIAFAATLDRAPSVPRVVAHSPHAALIESAIPAG